MDLKLHGKLALVSGSTAGIGLAIATTLAHEGARVIVNGRSQSSVEDVVAAAALGDRQRRAGLCRRSRYCGGRRKSLPGATPRSRSW